MGKRLTEDMVISRTKISDLSKVKRLNCWGSELEDVSLLRRMPYVEVLSLSINKINSLADFQYCKRLEELYIRQNDIRDVNEIMYLQNLTNLKNLWLDENPCAHVEGYRLAVIKALPQLQKLDNIAISTQELQEAQRKGKSLSYPNEEQEVSEEEYAPPPPTVHQQRIYDYRNYSPEYSPPQPQSPIRQETTEYELEESEDLYPREDASEESRDLSPPTPLQVTPPRRHEQIRRSYSPEPEYVDRRNSYETESPRQQYYEKSPSANNSFEGKGNNIEATSYRENKIVNSQSASCIKEYTNGERYSSPHGGSDTTMPHSQERRERYSCPAAAHRPPFNRRPVTRNSNILSAVLCLVKELDYPSLEVVEMAVRCRMDELDE